MRRLVFSFVFSKAALALNASDDLLDELFRRGGDSTFRGRANSVESQTRNAKHAPTEIDLIDFSSGHCCIDLVSQAWPRLMKLQSTGKLTHLPAEFNTPAQRHSPDRHEYAR